MVNAAKKDGFGSLPEVDATRWTTKDGRSIAIADLGDAHLTNIVAMLKRADMKRASEAWFYLNGPQPTGMHAQDAHASEMAQYDDVSFAALALVPIYKALLAELKKRKK